MSAQKKLIDKFPNTPDEARRELIKLVNGAAYGMSVYDIWNDFLEMAYTALLKHSGTVNPEIAEKLEARYMAVVHKQRRNPEIIREIYPAMLAIISTTLQNHYSDLLGMTASELSVLNSNLGQFFTPYSLAQLSAEMCFDETQMRAAVNKQGYIKLHEPASGSGGMVIAFIEVAQKHNFNLNEIFVQCIDVSQNCQKMCFIQLHLMGVAAQVIHGNTLSMEMFEIAHTGGVLSLSEGKRADDYISDNPQWYAASLF